MSGEFAQRKTGGSGDGKFPCERTQRCEACQTVDVEGGLAVTGAGEFGFGALPGDLAEAVAQSGVGFAEKCGGFGKLEREVLAHSHGLGALPGEQECDAFFGHKEEEWLRR